MTRPSLAVHVLFTLVVVAGHPLGAGQGVERLSGTWVLNRSLSEFPKEIGFNPEWLGAVPPPEDDAASGRGGRGGRGGGGRSGAPAGYTMPRESKDDAARNNLLTGEVKSPPSRLTIDDAAAAITIRDDSGSRTFHPTAREEALATTTMGLPDIVVMTRREGDRVVVTYNVEEGRKLRYTYSTTANPRQLNVDAEFVEKRGTQKVHRVYDVAPVETAAAAATPARGLSGVPGAAGPPRPTGQPVEKIDQRPDAGLQGLKALGFVVEQLSPEAAACGLKQDALDTSLSKRLADAGFTVRHLSDDDAYVYVNINTTKATISPTTSLCVSRYDVFVYTHVAAKLAWGTATVLSQVQLLHDGGIAGGGPSAHATGVQKGLEGIIDSFASRIRDANK